MSRKLSAETRSKMSARMKGNTHGKGNKGNKHSAETKKKISESLKKYNKTTTHKRSKLTEQHKNNIAKALKGKPTKRPHKKTRAKMRASRKAHIALPLYGKCNCLHHKKIPFGEMRDPTKLEKILYRLLRKAKISFKREKQLGKYYVDAYSHKYKLVFEAYGKYWHTRPDRIKHDKARVKYLLSRKDVDAVIVFWEDELKELSRAL